MVRLECQPCRGQKRWRDAPAAAAAATAAAQPAANQAAARQQQQQRHPAKQQQQQAQATEEKPAAATEERQRKRRRRGSGEFPQPGAAVCIARPDSFGHRVARTHCITVDGFMDGCLVFAIQANRV